MDQQNPGSQRDEEAWLSAQSAELTASSRIRQRREREQFETRQEEDEAAKRLAKFVLIVLLLSLGIVMLVLAPALWEALHRWHVIEPGILLSVVAAPRLEFPFVTVLPCRNCRAEISIIGPPRRLSQQLVEEYSAGHICHLDSDVLKGLLRGEEDAFGAYKAFKMPWYRSVGVPQDRAEEFCRMICRQPAPEMFAAKVLAELERRAGPPLLFPLEFLET